MERPSNLITKRRAIALVLVIAVIFAGFSLRLFQVEIVEGKSYAEMASKSSQIQVPIAASRGEILDCNSNPLVINRPSFSIIFDYAFFPHGNSDDDQKKENDIILSLTDLLTSKGSSWNDTLPISKTSPYSFEDGRENSISNLKNKYRLSDSATADQCAAALVDQFSLQDYTPEQQRTIMGVRYGLDSPDFSLQTPYTFSSDITEDVYNVILENNDKYPGVDVQTNPVREYVDGTIAPHLLGTVGPIYAEEYSELKDKGYQLSDTIGKSGIEQAMESELRGTNGVSTITEDNGTVVDKQVTTEPTPGDTVILTLDSGLEKSAQDALNDEIINLRKNGPGDNNGHDVKSGSVVMLDVKTGGVLVSTSWPNYDLSTYKQNYSQLISDPDKPLWNRALSGAYPCGSTIKPLIALAGLTEGTITPSTTLTSCSRVDPHSNKGAFTLYEYGNGQGILHCWSVHHNLTVEHAIEQSCDVFFYDLGHRLGIDKMAYYATQFGLAQKTGIELPESAGSLDTPDYRVAHNDQWLPTYDSTFSIGQGDNTFTPIQLATYAMTIADNGVRYKTHLVKSLRSYDGTETPVETQVAATTTLSQDAIDTVKKGMVDVVKNSSGTAYADFRGATYSVAAKTGTAQVNGGSDDGVFIAYAPADNPQVAIAVVLENGLSHPAADVGKSVLDAYFASKSGS